MQRGNGRSTFLPPGHEAKETSRGKVDLHSPSEHLDPLMAGNQGNPMRLLKHLFRREEEPDGSAFAQVPTQTVPGLEPIIVQAIESLFPNADQRKKAFEYALEYKRVYQERIGREDTLGLLAMLAYSHGRIEGLPSPSLWFLGRFRVEEIDSMFPNMKKAVEWVRSIS